MAVKASERVQRYVNANGPTIGTVERKVLSQDGLYFKDIDGTGTVSAVNDWRRSPEERAQAYVKTLTTSEKIGQLFTSDWRRKRAEDEWKMLRFHALREQHSLSEAK